MFFSGCLSIKGLSSFDFLFILVMTLLNFWVQGTTVRVEFGDATTTADPTDALTISRAFPNTYGHPLAHFLRATAKVPDAQIITEFPPIRYVSGYHGGVFLLHCYESVCVSNLTIQILLLLLLFL